MPASGGWLPRAMDAHRVFDQQLAPATHVKLAHEGYKGMKDCFIIMPISTPSSSLSFYRDDADHFRHVLQCLFWPAVEKAGLKPISPIVEGAGVIHAEIIQKLEQSDLVLCDISTLNANVFLELGIRTALDKPVAMVYDEAIIDLPFDIGSLNMHKYRSRLEPWNLQEEIDSLAKHIVSVVASGNSNPLWQYFALRSKATMVPHATGVEGQLALLSSELSSLRNRMEKPSRTLH